MTLRVAITTTSFGAESREPLSLIEQAGLQVVLNPFGRKLRPDEVISLCAGAQGIIAGTEALTAEVLHKLPSLRIISRCGTGVDNIDLHAAAKLGIRVANTPDAPTLAVAELTIGCMLDLLRRITLQSSAVKAGTWRKEMGNLLSGKNVGIVGFGRIGRKVGELLQPFNVKIAYHDIVERSCPYPCERMSLDALLPWADIVSLHLSGSASGAGSLIGSREIRSMKMGGWIINAARGGLVDETALYDALQAGQVAGAALDVFGQEPYLGPLRDLDAVVLTPHIGSYARESRIEMEMQAVKNLLEGLEQP